LSVFASFCYFCSPQNGPVAQWIEQLPSKQWVRGSNPLGITKLQQKLFDKKKGRFRAAFFLYKVNYLLYSFLAPYARPAPKSATEAPSIGTPGPGGGGGGGGGGGAPYENAATATKTSVAM